MSSENKNGVEREAATELLDRLSKQRERLLNALAAVGEDNRQSSQSRPYRRISRSESQEGGTGSTMNQEKLIKELSDGLQPELWLRSLNLHQAILASLEGVMEQRGGGGGDEESGESGAGRGGNLIECLGDMTKEDVTSLVQSAVPGLIDTLWGGVTALQGAVSLASPPPPAQEMPLAAAKFLSPFCVPPAEFPSTGLQGFSCPLDQLLGPPVALNPLAAMKREHCDMPDSARPFTPALNGKPTTPAQEWHWVGESTPPLNNPDARKFVGLDQLMDLQMVKDAGLSKAEVAALRLYTGPMGDVYNVKLQGGAGAEAEGDDKDDGPDPDAYVTTLHCLVSAVVKLTKASPASSLCVYRPLASSQLPDALMADGGALRVAVEKGCLSTTLHKALAVDASAALSLSPAILEIQLGQVHGGASIQELSLFPDEGEVVVTPMSRVELDGEPRVELVGERFVKVFPLRLSVNFAFLTLEQREERRKVLSVSMLSAMREETFHVLRKGALDTDKDKDKDAEGGEGGEVGAVGEEGGAWAGRVRMREEHMRDLDQLLSACKLLAPADFNQDQNFHRRLEETLTTKTGTERRFAVWRGEVEGLVGDDKCLQDAILLLPANKFANEGYVRRVQTWFSSVAWESLVDGSLLAFPTAITAALAPKVWDCVCLSRPHRAKGKIQMRNRKGDPMDVDIDFLDSDEWEHGSLRHYRNSADSSRDLTQVSFGPDVAKLAAPMLLLNTFLLTLKIGGGREPVKVDIAEAREATDIDLSTKDLSVTDAIVLTHLFASCSHLTRLDLRGNNIGDEGERELASTMMAPTRSMPLLTCLNGLKASDVMEATDLDVLEEEGFNFQRRPVPSLSASEAAFLSRSVARNTQLQSLGGLSIREGATKWNLKSRIDDWKHKHAAVAFVCSRAGRCESLRDLYLRENNLGLGGGALLAEWMPSLAALHTLDLYNNNLGAEGSAALAKQMKHLTNLQRLQLSCNQMGVEGCAVLGMALRVTPQLTKLFLSNNDVGDLGSTAVAAALSNVGGLRVFQLSSNAIGSKGAVALAAALSSLHSLQEISLSRNMIGPEGGAALAEVMQHTVSLNTLDLGYNLISEPGCWHFARSVTVLSQLRQLCLEENGIKSDWEAARALYKAAGEHNKKCWIRF